MERNNKELEKQAPLVSTIQTAAPSSVVTPTIKNTAPAKRPTSTENPREFLWAHVALIFIALVVALPSPVAKFWGGATAGSPAAALSCAGGWALLTAYFWRKIHGASQPRWGGPWAAGLLMIDIAGLTALLSVSGAAQNPFTMLYFVPITLATLVSHRSTWRIAALAICAFGLLLIQTAAALKPHSQHPHHAHFFDHVQGMAIALAVAGVFITVFVGLIARSLSAQRRRIEELSERQKRDRFVVTLGTLSAGAAHELGSPLGTIQMLADDFVSLNSEEQAEAARTISQELKRIKGIVHSMQSSQLSADLFQNGEPWALHSFLEEFRTLPDTQVIIEREGETAQPRKVIEQIVRELHRNARQAAPSGQITVRLGGSSQEFTVVVEDPGPGLPVEQLSHVVEPFVSYNGGTGLGLFLSSIHAEQLGGQFSLLSEANQPTQAVLTLPWVPPQHFLKPQTQGDSL